MSPSIDYNALKARTLGSGADEEAVTVNTRALIDKVLARYSGEWTVLRELLQNAADACATRVTIKIETVPSTTVPLPSSATGSDLLKHTVTNHTVKRLLVTNNGQPFNDSDWSRLKRIAEGNPDETKIGAFGVGFYSVFADCEEPFVSSGNEAMAFYWKGNSLFTRRLRLSEADATQDTSFVLDYRNTTSTVPSLLRVSQFLASSLTFVGIQEVELWLDEHSILRLSKKIAPSLNVDIPHSIETKTSEGLMKVKSMMREVAQVDGSWMDIVGWSLPGSGASRLESYKHHDTTPTLRSFFSRLTGSSTSKDELEKTRNDIEARDVTLRSSSVIFLNVNTASIETFTSRSFKDELERATKKPPPKTTRLAILTSLHVPDADVDGSDLAKAGSADVLGSILPTKSGRIFIGFPTHQTTGLQAHISAPSVIPTVERESIDLNARWVRTWNVEMLRAAGIACRIAWSSEMATLDDNIRRALAASRKSKVRADDISTSLPGAISAARTFSFRESTPNPQTGQIIEDAFWTCHKETSIEVLSTCGVLPSHQVRIAPKNLSFMEGIPTLPERLVSDAKTFVDRLTSYGLITEVTVTDIQEALDRSALSPSQLQEFLAWLANQCTGGKLDRKTVRNLLAVAVANEDVADDHVSRILVLADVKYFLNPTKIPSELPIPPSTMPFRHTKQISKADLEAFGWEELQIVPWVTWLLEEAGNRRIISASQDLTLSAKFASQVLAVLSKQWEGLSQTSKATMVELLSPQTVIPTKLGMRRPGDSYFPSVKVFDDLPVVCGLNSVKEKFLAALGVRKTLELSVVFSRLLSDTAEVKTTTTDEKSQPKHVRLIHYLASVREDIPTADVQRLRDTPICPKEDPQDPRSFSSRRYKVSSLYEPKTVLRELGLPILSWSGSYRSGSQEGKLLVVLGLRTAPSAAELVNIMVQAAKTGNMVLRDKAMGYFIANHDINGYTAYDYLQVKESFLPLQNSSELSTPALCFTNEGAALFGLNELKRELQPHAAKFGVRAHPPLEKCIETLLRKRPASRSDARAVFAYFSGRLHEINSTNIPKLSQANFVPIFKDSTGQGEKGVVGHASPSTCFLGKSDDFGDIFHYVDFGEEANAFLIKCGCKHEPTKVEIAQLLVNEPARISSTFEDPEKYLNLLRNLANSLKVLKKEKVLFKAMKQSPFLFASKEVAPEASPVNQAGASDDSDDEAGRGIREWHLTTAAHATIVDDFASYSLFKTHILAAPQETLLEEFYYNLGSPTLSSLVEESAQYGDEVDNQKPAARLHKQICERSRLLLHDQPPDAVSHDAKWLEKNLNVVVVSSIKLRRSLKGRNLHHVDRRGAAVTQSGRGFTLWISGNTVNYYQVSQSLVHILLNRPKMHSALTLEMLLKTDLKELGARGFNVSRILRQNAAEKRLADQQQQLEDERRKRQKSERDLRLAKEQTREPAPPGHFPPDSPDGKAENQDRNPSEEYDEPIRKVPQGLFEMWRNRYGLNASPRPPSAPSTEKSPLLGDSSTRGNEEEPPPYSQEEEKKAGHQQESQPSSIPAPHQMQQNLLSAIEKCRPYNSNSVLSRAETTVVPEAQSYCDESVAQDLTLVPTRDQTIFIFVSRHSIAQTRYTPSTFVTHHSPGLHAFAVLLKDCAQVFRLELSTLNIFYAQNKSIAFNKGGSIFCNYMYFQQFHEQRMLDRVVDGGGDKAGRTDALMYWWVTLCHELAHNLVAEHNARHGYWVEQFVAEYAVRMMGKLAE